MTIEIMIGPGGKARTLYNEAFDFVCLGEAQIHRASFVEPDELGRWIADLSPVSGPKLGPFSRRSAALESEVRWLRRNVLGVAELKED